MKWCLVFANVLFVALLIILANLGVLPLDGTNFLFFFFVMNGVEGGVATLKPVLRSHVALLSAGAWNKHEQSMRPVGLLR